MAFDIDEQELIVLLAGAGGCSLDSSPKKNWVENNGGLPNYVCRIARALIRSGHPKSQAIAIAVSRAKAWSHGGTVNGKTGSHHVKPETAAKAATASAQWEALKARDHAKKAVHLSREGEPYIFLTNVGSFNTKIVAEAWQDAQNALRLQNNSDGLDSYGEMSYIQELWTDHIIVAIYGDSDTKYASIDYTVDNGVVSFGAATPVEQTYTPITKAQDPDQDGDIDIDAPLTDNERELLEDVLKPDDDDIALSRILNWRKKG